MEALADIIAVVPAAGTGSRMQSACPKQYLCIDGKTLLEHAVYRLLCQPRIRTIIIALHPQDSHFSRLSLGSHPKIQTVTGGSKRVDSVLAALSLINDACWVLVHDAARPCLHDDDLAKLLAITAYSQDGGILATPVRDTMKRGNRYIDHTVDRNNLWHALTPQLFPLTLLRDCLYQAQAAGVAITDEASALEYCGLHPELICGRADNIKVTQPEDLILATFYLSQFPL